MNYTLPFSPNHKVIELGGGTVPMFRPNVDVRSGNNIDFVADFNKPLPIASEEWDGVFCKYVIEHLSWRKVKSFLKEVFRILKQNGTVVFITANTEAQMRHVLSQEEWNDNSSCIIFGDQDYEENTHRNSLSPLYAMKLIQETGFSDVFIVKWGELGTDMLIEATKKETCQDPKLLFDKNYFDGGGKVGGYRETYRDNPINWVICNKILELKPESVLELGCARGYVIKKLKNSGVRVMGLDVSNHCFLTRATNSVLAQNICQTPWSIPSGDFDVCFSSCFLEHIPEEQLPVIFEEMQRVARRGLHIIDFNSDGFDKTICNYRPIEWWQKQIPTEHQVVDKKELENTNELPFFVPPGDGKIKVNIGSFTEMFHHGWINLDIASLENFAIQNLYKFLQYDARQTLPFADNTVDLIYSSHFLEHLKPKEGLNFLKECHRILKPNGCARLIVPDTNKLINLYMQEKLDIFNQINDGVLLAKSNVEKLWALLFPGHETAYDLKALESLAIAANFTKNQKCEFEKGNEQIIKETIDSLPELSLYFEIYKV